MTVCKLLVSALTQPETNKRLTSDVGLTVQA